MVVVFFLNSGGLYESNFDVVDFIMVCYVFMMFELLFFVIYFELVSFDYLFYIMYLFGIIGVFKCIVYFVGGIFL